MRIWTDVAKWWRNSFTGFDRREAWGYGVWLSFGLLVLVPELWAAFWKNSASWPTISGTVGALEYDHPILALVVTGVIALCFYSAFRYPPLRTGVLPSQGKTNLWIGEDTLLPYRTALGGRFTRSTTSVRELRAWLYFPIALIVIVALTTVAATTSDLNDEYRVGQTLYGLTALFWVVIPNILAWPKRFAADVPFPTLFSTVRSLERRLRFVAYAVVAGLVILLLHLVLYPWPSTVPDISRLHKTYKCHPLQPAEQPLTPKEKEECQKLDDAEIRPAPAAD